MADKALTFPASIDAERVVLGQILTNGRLFDEARSLGLEGQDFHSPYHSRLWRLLEAMAEEGNPLEAVAIQERAARGGRGDHYGGLAYIVQLPDFAATTANLPHYVQIVRDQAVRRRGIVALEAAREELARAEEDPGRIASAVAGRLDALVGTATRGGFRHIGDLARVAAGEATQPAERSRQFLTGLEGIDLQAPVYGADLVVLAARPGVGKTALALAIAHQCACEAQDAVGVFSLEMSSVELTQRLIARISGVPVTRLRAAGLSARDEERVWDAEMQLSERADRLWIDDTFGLHISELRARARRLHAKVRNGLRLLIVDYLQLVRGDGESEETRISSVAKALKGLAKELGIPVIALAQLNREVEKRARREPQLSDLRGSGEIEQTADQIWFLCRPYAHDKAADPAEAWIEVAKNRAGACGKIPLIFHGPTTTFRDHPDNDGERL